MLSRPKMVRYIAFVTARAVRGSPTNPYIQRWSPLSFMVPVLRVVEQPPRWKMGCSKQKILQPSSVPRV